MLEWILIVILTLAGGVGWFKAATGTALIDNSVKTEVSTATYMNTGVATIVEREMQGVAFDGTNVPNPADFYATLAPFQRREVRFTPIPGGLYFAQYPVPFIVSKTNEEKLIISNERGKPPTTNRIKK